MKKLILLSAFLLTFGSFAQSTDVIYGINMQSDSDARNWKADTDSSGNLYVLGSFNGTVDVNSNGAPSTLFSSGNPDIYIAKYDPSGLLIWVKSFSSSGYIYTGGISVDDSGSCLLCGSFRDTADLDPGASVDLHIADGTSLFILELDAGGNFLWAKTLASTPVTSADCIDIATDTSGNIYLTGSFSGTVDFDPGAGSAALIGTGTDAFILKLDQAGNYIWAKSFTGSGNDFGTSIVVDSIGNVYTTGSFENTVDFDPGAGVVNLASAGNYDCFFSKLDPSGNFIWAKRIGSTSYDQGVVSCLDPAGNFVVSGTFRNTVDMDPGAGVVNVTSAGTEDIFVLELDASGNYVYSKRIGGPITDQPQGMTMDENGTAFIVGAYMGVVDFDPGAAVFNLGTVGSNDGFILELDNSGNFIRAGAFTSGSGYDVWACGVAVDQNDDVYVAGRFIATADLDPFASSYTIPSSTSIYSGFAIKLGELIPTTMDESANLSNVLVYPNPSTGIYHLSIPASGTLEVCNALGQSVLAKKIAAGTETIDLQDQPGGIYFLRVESEGRIIGTQKIIR